MTNSARRPTFIDDLLTDLRDDYRRYGVRKLFPSGILFCAGLGAAAAYLLPGDFWLPANSLVFFTAIVTVNGLFLALSWNSFGRIYEICSQADFAAYLRKNNLLNSYFFIVDYIHYSQVLAVVIAALGLIMSAIVRSQSISADVVFGATIASSLYALYYALGAVRVMQDLVRNRADFDSMRQSSPPMTVVDGGR